MSLGIQRWDFYPHGSNVAAVHPGMGLCPRLEEVGKGAKVKVKRNVGYI